MDSIISVEHLSRRFKQYKKEPGLKGSLKSIFHREFFYIDAVKDVSFEIEKGEMLGFIGPNGAGKTTTLKMLSGILYPSSGKVEVLGYKPFERKKEFLKSFSLVMGQKSQLWWDIPAMDGFMLNKEIYEVKDKNFKDTVHELAKLLEVEDILNIPVKKLSLGQRMKCELIAALLHNPSIMFLDEPTIGLDVVVQKKIRKFFKEYNQLKKTTVILTSHNMDDVEELCKRIIVINKGIVIYDGNISSLMNQYAKDKYLKVIFNESVSKNDLLKLGKVINYSKDGLTATLGVPRASHTQAASALLTKFSVDDLDIAETTLEDIIANIFVK